MSWIQGKPIPLGQQTEQPSQCCVVNTSSGVYSFFDTSSPGKAIQLACQNLELELPEAIETKPNGVLTATVGDSTFWASRVEKPNICPGLLKIAVFDSQFTQRLSS